MQIKHHAICVFHKSVTGCIVFFGCTLLKSLKSDTTRFLLLTKNFMFP